MAKHTPTPWRVKPGQTPHRGTVAVEEDGRFIETVAEVYCGAAEGHGQANAEFIVRACNSHEKLLDLLLCFNKLYTGGYLIPSAPEHAPVIDAVLRRIYKTLDAIWEAERKA